MKPLAWAYGIGFIVVTVALARVAMPVAQCEADPVSMYYFTHGDAFGAAFEAVLVVVMGFAASFYLLWVSGIKPTFRNRVLVTGAFAAYAVAFYGQARTVFGVFCAYHATLLDRFMRAVPPLALMWSVCALAALAWHCYKDGQ